MSNNKSLSLPVCWHEGMLLSPQHFQQNHIYWEQQTQSLLATLPYHWGVIAMELDEARLIDGVVYLTRLSALMPDGLLIDYDVREETPLEINLADQEWSQQNTIKVQLTVPIRLPGSACSSSDIQRFTVEEGELVKDDNTGEEEMAVPRLKPIIALATGERIGEQYASIPLLEISQIDGAHYQISDYCPPLLTIAADGFVKQQNNAQQQNNGMERVPLQARLQSLAYKIRQKARLLAGFAEEDEEILGRKISEQHKSWIKAMVQPLVELELLADSDITSPWQAYQILARLMGALCELDNNHIPPKLPAYQHDDCGRGLSFAMAYIEQCLDKVNLRYSSLSFEEGQDGVFTITFDKAWNRNKLLIELKPHGHQTQAELIQWLQNCRIASSKMHKDLSIKRLLGASVEQVEYDEATGMQALPGHALFYINADPRFIKPSQSLALVCTSGKLKNMQPKRIVLHLPHEVDGQDEVTE